MSSSRRELLLERLDAIGASLERSGHALALLGLGSVGTERERLDEYSDLDFFAIVESGYKQRYLDNLDWLTSIAPVAYAFRNTRDGYKLLYEDGIFCEFAVFEPEDLRGIPFAAGRLVWKQAEVPDSIASPAPSAPAALQPAEWMVGEALTNLYVGLGRYHRGERLAAMRLIQVHAVDRILQLADLVEPAPSSPRDPFAPERRAEQRFPALAEALPSFTQGYERSVESARAILSYLESRHEVNPSLRQAILELCGDGDATQL